MAERRSLVLINGQIQELPSGDSLLGGGSSAAVVAAAVWKEPASVWNSGDPQLLFDGTGDVVMTDPVGTDTYDYTAYYDNGSTSGSPVYIDYSTANHQGLTLTGSSTIEIINWLSSGSSCELWLELVAGNYLTAVTNVYWVKNDGTLTTDLASLGVTLQSSGVDFILFWTHDGGTTVYARVVR